MPWLSLEDTFAFFLPLFQDNGVAAFPHFFLDLSFRAFGFIGCAER